MSPQVSLYIERLLYMEIKNKAKEEGKSLSSYVSDVLREHNDDKLPEGHMKKYFGIIEDETFKAPKDRPESWDSKREIL